MRAGSVRYLLVIGVFILSSCSSSVRSLQPEEVRDSGANEVLFFTTEGRVLGSQPDSCLLLSGPDSSVQVLEIRGGREYTDPHRKASKPFSGQVARTAVDSIEGRYKPVIDPIAPVFVGLVVAVVTIMLLIQFHTISWKQ
jgi:hypothetical protein